MQSCERYCDWSTDRCEHIIVHYHYLDIIYIAWMFTYYQGE